EYFAIHVDKVNPPALPPMEEKRALLTQAWVRERLITALKSRADGLLGQIHKGGSLEQAAVQSGAHVVREAGMQRIKAQQYKALGNEFLQAAFAGKPGDVFAAGGPGGIFLVRLDAVRPADIHTLAQATQAVRPRLAQDYLNDISGSVKAAARQSMRVIINRPLACRSLGVDPAVCSAGGGAAGGKAP
ncbi:MAG: peptidylprolyl isomerase, partial [Caulobacteraceae bacterium]